MSEREYIKQVIDRLPEYKLAYVTNLILDVEKMSIEEIEPDEIDLEMIERAKRENDGEGTDIKKLQGHSMYRVRVGNFRILLLWRLNINEFYAE